jgi:hypothetical protein
MLLRALVALLLLCSAAHANLIQAKPPAIINNGMPPPEAVAAGMTIPALVQDFSVAFNHECQGQNQPEMPGIWHTATNGILFQLDCSALTWP